MDDVSVRNNSLKLTTYSIILLVLATACSSNPKGKAKIITKPGKDAGGIQSDSLQGSMADTVYRYDSTKTYIYITLDDGPQKGTMNCYYIFKKEAVKASFFMIGAHINNEADVEEVNEIKDSYPQFLLCNHSFSHANFNHYHSFYDHPDSALRDIEKNQQLLAAAGKIVRTPGNNSWMVQERLRAPKLTKSLCHLLDSAGYKVAGWDVEWKFTNNSIPVQSAERMANEVNQYAQSTDLFKAKHVVILAHDRMFSERQYADSLQKFISLLKSVPQYVFETIDHYPGMKAK